MDFQKRADLCVELPNVRMISRVYPEDGFPQLRDQKFAVFVGVHKVWTDTLIKAVDKFCEMYNAVVLYDHTRRLYIILYMQLA